MEPQQRMEHLPEDRDDGGLPPFQEGVGEILRRRRESYGQDLPTVASQLHIRLTYLRAVETGRFKDLPGMAYASGFVRSYGDYLGLDGEELVRLFREEVAGVDRQVRLNVPIVASEGRIPGGAVLLLSGFLAILAYGVWYYLADRNKSLLDLVPEVPSQLRAILGKEVPTNVATVPPMVKPQSATAPAQGGTATAPAQGNAAPASAPDPAVPSGVAGAQEAAPAQPTAAGATPSTIASQHATLPVPGVTKASPAEPQAPATSVLVQPDDPAPLPGEFNALLAARQPPGPDGQPLPPPAQVVMANPGARVKLVARMDSWVQINDKTGKTYYSAVLRAGQAIEVPNQPGLLLTAGNAGGLDVLVDGTQMPSLGAVGLVKRDLPLDPAGLKTTNGH
ncbi:MAG TPA: RodZ domain-containing protein [Dongiaceae bacterium]